MSVFIAIYQNPKDGTKFLKLENAKKMHIIIL